MKMKNLVELYTLNRVLGSTFERVMNHIDSLVSSIIDIG
jgi:hypothetical protein